jgi:hypothetical protein
MFYRVADSVTHKEKSTFKPLSNGEAVENLKGSFKDKHPGQCSFYSFCSQNITNTLFWELVHPLEG